jgi:uncharacterized protein
MPSRPIVHGLFEQASEGPRLLAARCIACGKVHFPASATCPYCGADAPTPTLVGPAGQLRLFTVVANRPPGYRGPVPYGFGVVEVDGVDLQVITRLTENDLQRLRPGLPVTLVIEPLFTDDEGATVMSYAFAPAVAS